MVHFLGVRGKSCFAYLQMAKSEEKMSAPPSDRLISIRLNGAKKYDSLFDLLSEVFNSITV
jgi:hypothetical protein